MLGTDRPPRHRETTVCSRRHPSCESRLTAAEINARWVNAWGKLPSASPDGLQGEEGTFSICTFWYVEAMARAGHLDEARLAFEKMLTYANHLGLYSEEIGPTGEALGNFPQAFTHLALISAAVHLDKALGKGF